jgi:hypothetical protein
LWRPNVLTINYYGNGAQYMNMWSTTINNNTLLWPDRFAYDQIIDECYPTDFSIPWGLQLSRPWYYANW